MGKFVRVPEQVPDGDGRRGSGGADAMEHSTPALYEYLRVSAWEDGKSRETSTLLTLWEEGAWKLCLHDRAQSRVLWVSAPSWAGALERLEATLAAGEGDWRRKAPWKGRKSG